MIGVVLLIVGFWLLIWLGPKIYEYFNPPAQRQTGTPPSSPAGPSPKPRTDTYRPRPSNRRPKIQFDPPNSGPAPDLKDLHDAFTGAPLNSALGLHQCTSCKV